MAEMTSSTLGRKARPAPEPEIMIIYVTMVVTGSLSVVAGQLNVCVTGDGNNL